MNEPTIATMNRKRNSHGGKNVFSKKRSYHGPDYLTLYIMEILPGLRIRIKRISIK
jgi:hypothetical protein